MTPEFGFGMLLMGFIAISIGASIAYYVINKITKKDRKNRRWDDTA